jgi:protein-tyrosine phosphatase
MLPAALKNDEDVYAHFRSGVGRTGTALALHLIRHGRAPHEALLSFVMLANLTRLGASAKVGAVH